MSSKRTKKARELVDPNQRHSLGDAMALIGKFPRAKFSESVEVAVRLGVDPRQSDQMVRGTVALPHGSGKEVKVLVFAMDGPAADAAKEAGAEFVGFDEMIKKVQDGWTGFDVAVATPDAMAEVRKLGRVLGPRGLMPNPKTGTVTEDTGKAVKELKAGRVEFKVDKAGNIHVPIGKVEFSPEQLVENAEAVIDALSKAKPASAKGKYFRGASVSATMSPSVKLEMKEFAAAL